MKLQEWIEREKMTHIRIAKAVECHPQMIRAFLKGKRTMSIPLAKEVSLYTNGEVSVDELVKMRFICPRCPHCKQEVPRDLVRLLELEKKDEEFTDQEDDTWRRTHPIPYEPIGLLGEELSMEDEVQVHAPQPDNRGVRPGYALLDTNKDYNKPQKNSFA